MSIKNKDFVAYDYLTLNISSEKESLYIDCYENLGWQLLNTRVFNGLVDEKDYYLNNTNLNNIMVNLNFKRDRKIPNKVKLIPLQKKCENSLKKITKLEKEPEIKGLIYALTMALIGVFFLSMGIYLRTISIMVRILMITAGLFLIILSYPIYLYQKNKQTKINTSLIEEEYNIIYHTLEEASNLLK